MLGLRRGFWGASELGADGLGDGGEGDVPVPAQPGAALEMVQAEAVFEFAVVVLDAPPHLG